MPPADDEARKVAEEIARKLFRYLSVNERAAELLLPILTAAFERVREEAEKDAVAFKRSIACMLGWMNDPPQDVIERDINALKARSAAAEAEAARLKAELEKEVVKIAALPSDKLRLIDERDDAQAGEVEAVLDAESLRADVAQEREQTAALQQLGRLVGTALGAREQESLIDAAVRLRAQLSEARAELEHWKITADAHASLVLKAQDADGSRDDVDVIVERLRAQISEAQADREREKTSREEWHMECLQERARYHAAQQRVEALDRLAYLLAREVYRAYERDDRAAMQLFGSNGAQQHAHDLLRITSRPAEPKP